MCLIVGFGGVLLAFITLSRLRDLLFHQPLLASSLTDRFQCF